MPLCLLHEASTCLPYPPCYTNQVGLFECARLTGRCLRVKHCRVHCYCPAHCYCLLTRLLPCLSAHPAGLSTMAVVAWLWWRLQRLCYIGKPCATYGQALLLCGTNGWHWCLPAVKRAATHKIDVGKLPMLLRSALVAQSQGPLLCSAQQHKQQPAM